MMTFLASTVTPATAIYLVNLAIAAVLISSCGLLAVLLFSRQSAPVRHAILVSTLVLTLLAPALTWWACRSGWGRIPISFADNAAKQPSPAPDALPVKDLAAKARPDALPSDAALPALPFVLHTRQGASRDDTRTASVPRVPQAIAPQPNELPANPPAAVSWRHVAIALAAWGWLIGTLIGAGRVARGFLILRRFRRSLEMPSLDHLDQAAREAAKAFGIVEAASRRFSKAAGCRFYLPPIRISARAPAPLSLGFLHPLIVLPKNLAEESDAEQLRAILVHEMAHLVHHHHWIGLMQWLAGILFWWNPLLHRVNRGIMQLREEICDDHVLQSHADGREFARVLVELAARLTDLPRIPATLAILETGYSDFQHRITNLLDKERTIVTRMTRKAVVLVVLFGLAISLAVPFAGLRAKENPSTINATTTPVSAAATSDGSNLKLRTDAASEKPPETPSPTGKLTDAATRTSPDVNAENPLTQDARRNKQRYVATMRMLEAKLRANYEQIKTWSGTYELKEGHRDWPADGLPPRERGSFLVTRKFLERYAIDVRQNRLFTTCEEARTKTATNMGTKKVTEVRVPFPLTERYIVTGDHWLESTPAPEKAEEVETGLRLGRGKGIDSAYRRKPGEARQYMWWSSVVDPRGLFCESGIPFWKCLDLDSDWLEADKSLPMKISESRSKSGVIFSLTQEFRPGGAESKATPDVVVSLFDSETGYQVTSVRSTGPNGKPLRDAEWKYARVSGVYIPQRFHFRSYNRESGELEMEREFTMVDAKLNEPIAEDQFGWHALGLLEGDQILDEIDHATFRYHDGKVIPAAKYVDKPEK